MYHHLKHNIIGNTRVIRTDCSLNAWLEIESRVKKGIETPKSKENIEVLVNSTIYNHPMGRYDSQGSNRPLVGMREIHERADINKNSFKIKNLVDNNEYLLDCLDSPFREFIPNFSDRIALGSIVAGIFHGDIEKARECHQNFSKHMLKKLSSTISWIQSDIVESYKKQENSEWRRKSLQDDLKEIKSNFSDIKMVAHVDIGTNISNIVQTIDNLIALDITKTEDLEYSKEFMEFELCLNTAKNNFSNLGEKNKAEKKRKRKP